MQWIRLKKALKHSLKGLFRGGGANELPTKMQNKENTTFLSSSVARGGGAVDQNAEWEKHYTFSTSRLFYALEWTK